MENKNKNKCTPSLQLVNLGLALPQCKTNNRVNLLCDYMARTEWVDQLGRDMYIFIIRYIRA